MNYQYIQQLVERYYNAETSVEEERILRAFFAQSDIPETLRRHRPLFAHLGREAQTPRPGADFDARLLAEIARRRAVGAHRITLAARLRPLVRAAAVVAVVCTVGFAAQRGLEREAPVYTPAPAGAPLQALDGQAPAVPHYSEGIETAVATDTLPADLPAPRQADEPLKTKGM